MNRQKNSFNTRLYRSFFAFPLLFILFSITACTQQSHQKLFVGTNVWPGYEPGYIAESEGLYTTGQIKMRQFSSATEVLRAFRNNTIDVAALTLDEAMQLAQYDPEVVVFYVADISDGADVILARPGIDEVADLKGRSIAAEASALGAFVISRALQLGNTDKEQLNIVSMTVDESVVAYEDGRVDSVVTFEPYRTRLLRQGAKEIFTSKEIPNEIVDVLVTKRSIIETKGNALRDLTRGWLLAINLIKTQPEIVNPLIAKRLELELTEVDAAFEGLILPDAMLNKSMLGGDEASLRKVAVMLESVLREKELLNQNVNVNGLFDASLLPN